MRQHRRAERGDIGEPVRACPSRAVVNDKDLPGRLASPQLGDHVDESLVGLVRRDEDDHDVNAVPPICAVHCGPAG